MSLINVLAATTLVACGDDKNMTDASTGSTGAATSGATDNPTTTVGTSNATDEATTTPTTTLPTTTEGTTMVGGETAADGEACSANDDCASVGCLKWRDLEMGECVPAPAGGNTRIAGTLLDFVAGTPIAGTELRVVGALTVALSADPATAPPVFTATSEADGQVDVTSTEPLAEGVGVVGVITGGDYYTTATGIAAPIAGVYGPMNGNRDIWALPAATLTEWSGYLMTDPEIMPSLPLGDAGGVVGFVRDGNGMGKAGAKIVSETNGAATTAKVRYLSDDGVSFNADATGASGIFVLVAPSLAEKFKVEGGTVIGTAGSAKKAVFVMILTEP
ncbi:MAG: hypothetical protein IPO88_01520 [Nannocystis sp.]|uniref:hypothetical protein n=1 Tax=Nannocystis sp. TaxID=1962667 RepID=UPI002427F7C2|nr:hypothetical protein [Nannocystis sp.]